jgi:hypothetical protein
MKAGRLKFNYRSYYAIQVRKIKEDFVDFEIMILNMDKLEDITAVEVDKSFRLEKGGDMKIDLDKDGKEDLIIRLIDIFSGGKTGNLRFADFSVEKLQ